MSTDIRCVHIYVYDTTKTNTDFRLSKNDDAANLTIHSWIT